MQDTDGDCARRKLSKAWPSLVQDLTLDSFLDQLIALEVIGIEVREQTKAECTKHGRTAGARVLLEFLLLTVRQHPGALAQIIVALDASGQPHLADLLKQPIDPPDIQLERARRQVESGVCPGSDSQDRTTVNSIEEEGCTGGQSASSTAWVPVPNAGASSCQGSKLDKRLCLLRDPQEVGMAIAKHLTAANCEDLARHIVKSMKGPVHNFRAVVKEWIRRHDMGQVELSNVPALLAYYNTGNQPTCRDLLDILQKISPAVVSKVTNIIESADFDA